MFASNLLWKSIPCNGNIIIPIDISFKRQKLELTTNLLCEHFPFTAVTEVSRDYEKADVDVGEDEGTRDLFEELYEDPSPKHCDQRCWMSCTSNCQDRCCWRK